MSTSTYPIGFPEVTAKTFLAAALGTFPVGERSMESDLSFDQEEGVADDAKAAQKHGRDRNQRI